MHNIHVVILTVGDIGSVGLADEVVARFDSRSVNCLGDYCLAFVTGPIHIGRVSRMVIV